MQTQSIPILEFTGERCTPGLDGNIALEHIHRYTFALPAVKGARVLDIACGEGYGSNMLAREAKSVIGVDICPKTIAYAERAYGAQTHNLTFRVGKCEEIPLPDNSIDVVVSFETIEHFTDHDRFFSEIKRVLVPDGLVIISSPNKEIFTDEAHCKNSFHLKELYADEFKLALATHFEQFKVFGQRVVHGSFIFPDTPQAGECPAYYSGSFKGTKRHPTMPKPVYLIGVAGIAQAIDAFELSFFEGDGIHSDVERSLERLRTQLALQKRRLSSRIDRAVCRIAKFLLGRS